MCALSSYFIVHSVESINTAFKICIIKLLYVSYIAHSVVCNTVVIT